MKINEIEITIEELHQAVQDWLKARGLTIQVENVKSFGYPVQGFKIEVAEERPPLPASVAELKAEGL